MESPTKLHGIHVTSDPQPVLDVLRSGGDISKGRVEGLVGDLGSSGLYFSQSPQLWTGRAYGKWEFLKGLSKTQREKLGDKLTKELQDERSSGYITEWELESALRYIDQYVNHDFAGSIVMIAGQPYNIGFWKEKWLSPLGIEQARPPMYIEVEAEGLFADLTGMAITPDLIQKLKEEGYDGAYHRGDMINLPQSVVWNTNAITKFGEMSFAHNPAYWPIFAAGIASGVASGAAFAITGYALNKYASNPEIKVYKGALGTPAVDWPDGKTYMLSYRSWDGAYVFVDPDTKRRLEFAPPEGRKWETSPMAPGKRPGFSRVQRPGEWVYDPAARKVYRRPADNPEMVSPHPEEVEHLSEQVKLLWQKACEWEGIPPDSKVVIFSKDNPYNDAYNKAMTQYMKTRKEFYKAVGKLFERKREERMDNPIDDYKGFRAWITPIPEEKSEGKWDWDVKVQRLSDGKTKTLKVSGGWQVAESYVRQLMDELGEDGYAKNPTTKQPWEMTYRELRNKLEELEMGSLTDFNESNIVISMPEIVISPGRIDYTGLSAAHRSAISRALSQGFQVPAKVLREYKENPSRNVLQVWAEDLHPSQAKKAIDGWAYVFCYNTWDMRGPIITTKLASQALPGSDIEFFQKKFGRHKFRVVKAPTASNPKYMKFKDLDKGAVFIFASEKEFPYSGMAKGPWKKISSKKYILEDEPSVEHQVGSVNAEVIPYHQARKGYIAPSELPPAGRTIQFYEGGRLFTGRVVEQEPELDAVRVVPDTDKHALWLISRVMIVGSYASNPLNTQETAELVHLARIALDTAKKNVKGKQWSIVAFYIGAADANIEAAYQHGLEKTHMSKELFDEIRRMRKEIKDFQKEHSRALLGLTSNPEKPGVVWPVGAKLYDKQGKLVGVCLDTPNAIAKAMMEHPEIEAAHTLLGVKTREDYVSRMQPWNTAKSHFKAMAENPEGYQGWKNYETWNVALWMGNDEFWYDVAKHSLDYRRFKNAMINRHGITETPDGVKLRSQKLDRKALDELILDLGGGKKAIEKRKLEKRRAAREAKAQTGKYALLKDNKVIFEGTKNECLAFLQRHQGRSWDYAFKYGGYRLIPIKDLPPDVIRIPKGMTSEGFVYNPQNTPWGKAQNQTKLAKGVTWVSTSRHGGMMVSEGYANRNLSIAARKRALRYGKYYCYEEDDAWMIPAWELPQVWDELFKYMEPSNYKERKLYLLEGLSRWNADYLLDIHETPIQPQYDLWRAKQAEEKLRQMQHPNLITAAKRTSDPHITQVWTADGETHFVTAKSYSEKYHPQYPTYLTDMEIAHPPTPKAMGPADFVYNPKKAGGLYQYRELYRKKNNYILYTTIGGLGWSRSRRDIYEPMGYPGKIEVVIGNKKGDIVYVDSAYLKSTKNITLKNISYYDKSTIPLYMQKEVVKIFKEFAGKSKPRKAIRELMSMGEYPTAFHKEFSSNPPKHPDEMTLAEHAEAWWREQGKKVPRRNTKKWKKMYEKWVAFAFKDFGKNPPRGRTTKTYGGKGGALPR